MQRRTNLKFMCIGAQKSGTTWLYHQLAKHKQVHMPTLKEIHYFDELHRQVPSTLTDRWFGKHWMNKRWRKINLYMLIKLAKLDFSNAKWFWHYLYSERNWAWYDKLFANASNSMSGDITPDYAVLNEQLVADIHQRYPELKIIYLMRDPVERKWSQIKMVLGEQKGRDFKTVPAEQYRKAAEDWQDEHGNYAETIELWQRYYGKEQMFIGFYDELKQDPSELYGRILDFLGLPRHYEDSAVKKVVYGGARQSMPEEIYQLLCEQQRSKLVELKQLVGKLPDSWPNPS
ncbi:hypothetical protein GCM10011369_02330 [Neiella marina]|uniref:Sulfotransferase n=1 Tax=Neiella marina TaxID=508461 RepID=A0A8J2U208_9GAMM|nr:sulfotransferase [Neiella marina]GGA64505.1 hypothetical protein GCM10011369_02330 [Neiella marina]